MLTDGPLIRLRHLLPQGGKALTIGAEPRDKRTEIPAFAGMTRWLSGALLAVGLVASVIAAPTATLAETIANPVASFSGLDKITGRITKFDVYINETVLFGYADDTAPVAAGDNTVLAGALVITPRVCYTRPPTETQRTSVFVEVDRVDEDGKANRIFTGWMFADSPALNAIDDPVYDVWLDGCKAQTDVPPQQAQQQPAQQPAAPAQQPAAPAQEPAPAVTPPTQAQVIDDRG
jgi:hypothetical protein